MVHYIRHLPAKGSLGAPAIFKEEAEEHEHMHGAADHHDATPQRRESIRSGKSKRGKSSVFLMLKLSSNDNGVPERPRKKS